MSVDKPTKKWAPSDIDKMLELLPVMESPDFLPYTYPYISAESESDILVRSPYPTYHEVVDQLWILVYESSAFIDPYGPLPEGRGSEQSVHDGLAINLEQATLNQIRRYLVLITRHEHHSGGQFVIEFDAGRLVRALRRLKDLRHGL